MHDRNSTPLKVGDIVEMPCRILEVYSTEEFCNVRLETLYGRRPDGKKETFSAINTAQVVLTERNEA
jgi:hypothetical protein